MENQAILVRGGVVVPMIARGVWHEADILVADGRIVAVGRNLTGSFDEELDASNALVLPGFVQTHVHVVQTLARHRAEGLPLHRWLAERIWPYEAALSSAEVAVAARLGIAELLMGGTTGALDMGTTHDQDEVFRAADQLGVRLTSGKCLMDCGDGVPSRLLEDRATALAETEALGARWHGAANGRLRYAVAPRFALSCTEGLLREAAALARRHGWLLHTHASENRSETDAVRRLTGRGNVAYLHDLSISGTDTVLAHCVHLEDEEVELLAGTGTGVAHCPGANLKLASGIADLPRLIARDVRVGLGADGPPCNNRLSIFHEMSLAGTIHNLRSGPQAVDPWTVLEMATWRGAEVAGFEQVGRLQPGFRADLVVLSLDTWAMEPVADPAAVIVYGAGMESVRHVVVNGKLLVRDGRLESGDGGGIRREARAAATAIATRLGWQ